MRWLLLKDLQILRRSPGLVVLLAMYAAVIGIPVGYALSKPPAKPKVAFLNEVPPGQTTIDVGGQRIDASKYSRDLFKAIDPVRVKSRAEAIRKVKDGEALGALVVPAEVTQQLEGTVSLAGAGDPPTLDVYYNADNPIKRRYVESTIKARLADANQALAQRLVRVAAGYIGILVKGGSFDILGRPFDVLGLKSSAAILTAVERGLPKNDPQRPAIEQVRRFAQLAIDNLDLSTPVLGALSSPIRVRTHVVSGDAGSLNGFAVAVATAIALLFVGLLVGAGMLALEREEHAFGRLVRGLVGRTALVAEKVVLAAICAAAVGALLVVVLSLFEHVAYGRTAAWVAALVGAAAGFGALGVAIGAVTRDVRAASLLAFLVALPIAALALVPSGAVASGVYDVIRVVSALFPFKPALTALDAGLNATSDPGLWASLGHLAILVAAWGLVARLALRRFA